MDDERYYARPRRPWRWWVLPAVTRAGVAVGFTSVPTVAVRVDDAALTVVCVIMALAVWTALALDWYVRRIADRIDMAIDGLTVLVVVPLVALTGGLQVADGRFGGRLENVLAAFIASLAALFALVLIARVGPVSRPDAPIVAVLPAALSAAVVFGGPGLFTTSRFWQGVSLAWMLAAAVTFLCGIIAPRGRPILILVSYTGLALGVLIWSSSADGPNINPAANSVSVIAVVLIGLILISSSATAPSDSRPRRQRNAPNHQL